MKLILVAVPLVLGLVNVAIYVEMGHPTLNLCAAIFCIFCALINGLMLVKNS